jgi:hypothetical protein
MIVIHETEDENMTRKSKPAKELNMHMDNKDVITGTPSMIQPMNNDNIKREIMRTEVICRSLLFRNLPKRRYVSLQFCSNLVIVFEDTEILPKYFLSAKPTDLLSK